MNSKFKFVRELTKQKPTYLYALRVKSLLIFIEE